MTSQAHSPRRILVLLSIGALILTTAACGARLSNKQRTLALQGTGSGTGTTTTTANGSAGANTATSTGGTTTGGTQGTQGTAGTTNTSQGAAGSNSDLWPKCSATSSNNGGSTDTGVTATTINLANISNISGPVPGLFKSARDAAQAFVSYFNSTAPGGLCGRKLVLHSKDSRTDSGANRSATKQACTEDFAIVGSQSAFDDGGAQPVNQCKIVDIPAAAVTAAIQASPYVYAALSTDTHDISPAGANYFKSKFGDAVIKHAAFLYINAGASAENGKNDVKAMEKVGYDFNEDVYAIPIQSANAQGFAPYVQKMKGHGVQYVQWIGAYQEAADLTKAIRQGGFKPTVVQFDPTAYVPQFVTLAQGAAEGVYVYTPNTTIDANGGAEQQLYAQNLQRSGVSDSPTFFGQAAWSAMRLFVETAFKVGPKLTRAAMISELKKVKDWTGNGIHSKQKVGQKKTGDCQLELQVKGNAFVRVAPPSTGYLCAPTIHV